eukprot:COSAG01_NODE_3397_length_6144_cov_33.015550_5_plen_53_part_00
MSRLCLSRDVGAQDRAAASFAADLLEPDLAAHPLCVRAQLRAVAAAPLAIDG